MKEKKAKVVDDGVRRYVKVVEPEQHNGNIEYKRLVSSSVSRLRSLTTQMVYRLDEGHGTAVYRLGVEDDGCHSLLPYDNIAESARIVECIARSLNSVVKERVMIYDEIIQDNDTVEPRLADHKETTRIHEPSVWNTATIPQSSSSANHDDDNKNKQTSNTEPKDNAKRIQSYVRAELTIHRVETHMLDTKPIQLLELASSKEAMLKLLPPQTNVSSTNNGIHHPPHNNGTPSSLPANHTNGHAKVHANGETLSVGETLSARNIRVAVVGNVDAGKSTLIGTLTTSCLDDGRGKSRTAIMKHRHEIESGRTSTVSTHLMGFKSTGEPIAGRDQVRNIKRRSEDEIARESYRIITLMDLAGHEKYLKTTIHGVSSGFADHSLIMVNARHPPTHMTQHHLNLCCSFGIPVIIVFTKMDHCPEHAYKNCKEQVFKMLRSPEVGKRPYAVRDEADVAKVVDKLHAVAPLIETSCVSGSGIELLQKLLFSLPKRRRHENKVKRSFEFLVEDIFNVPGVGAVVSGFVNAGELTVGSNSHVYVGPCDDGTFLKTVAKSAHIARINTSHITSGQSACLAFSLNKELRKKLRRGMVVLKENPTSTRHFDAEICVLKGEGTTIRRSYQAYVHILNVRQSAYARHIEIVQNLGGMTASEDDEGIILRPGSRAKVTFEFAKRPEYIRPGMRMLFRDGRVRGVGIITGIPAVAAAS